MQCRTLKNHISAPATKVAQPEVDSKAKSEEAENMEAEEDEELIPANEPTSAAATGQPPPQA